MDKETRNAMVIIRDSLKTNLSLIEAILLIDSIKNK